MKKQTLSLLSAVAVAALVGTFATPAAAERVVKIAGFGAKSGVVRSFGINTEAVMQAAVEHINGQGGVKLGDGTMAMIEMSFDDDRCNAEEGISVLRKIASSDALVAVGPTCSNVAEPLFGILQRNVDDAGDSGLRIPVFTDTAIKGGLAKISEWAFRNVPNENEMYRTLFLWVKESYPDLESVFGGVEEDFAHSRFTWYQVMDKRAQEAGFEVMGFAKWLLADTNFTQQVREMKKAKADFVAISSQPFTLCGVLKEMNRQRVRPKLMIGLTSSSSMETLQGCPEAANGIIIPSSFAPVTDRAKLVAKPDRREGRIGRSAQRRGVGDRRGSDPGHRVRRGHGRRRTRSRRIAARSATDSRKLETTDGLIGTIMREGDGEATKPYLYVHAQDGQWAVLHDPNAS